MSKSSKFRADIQGLRAIAVGLVVLGHFGLLIPAGYIGVDVFFVISGYLITSLLVAELSASGTISFSKFYARRMARILPMASLVILATLGASLYWLPRLRLKGIGLDGVLSALSLENYRLASVGTDYFASAQSVSPLQHYWSLSIEEQFYVFWPLLLLIIAQAGGRLKRLKVNTLISIVLGVAIVASFAYSVRLTSISQPWSYYGLHTRGWELAVGALLAINIGKVKLGAKFMHGISWLGMALILGAAFIFTERTAYPGYATIMPILGAVLVILGAKTERMMNIWPLQYLGKISYSVYLWHWPIWVIAPIAYERSLRISDKLGLIVLTLVLSSLSFAFIEQTARKLSTYPRRAIVMGLGLSAFVALCGTGLYLYAGANRLMQSTKSEVLSTTAPSELDILIQDGSKLVSLPVELQNQLGFASEDKIQGCKSDNALAVAPANICNLGNIESQKLMVLFGDSHAWQWTAAFDNIAKSHDYHLQVITKSGCPASSYLHFNIALNRNYTECTEYRQAVFDYVDRVRPAIVAISSLSHNEATAEALKETIVRLQGSSAKVVYISDTAYPATNIPDCLALNSESVQKCSTTRTKATKTPIIRAAEQAIARTLGALVVDPIPWQCTKDTCPAIINNTIVYFDGSHISNSYTSWLTPLLEADLKPVL